MGLTRGGPSPEAIAELKRGIHTLKGDARVVGYPEVEKLCEKLEDVIEFAAPRSFHIPDEVDLLTTMAFQFLEMLLRKRSAALSGMDLDGLIRQLDETLGEAPPLVTHSSRPPAEETESRGRVDQLSAATRYRMGVAATCSFLASLEPSPTKALSRASWKTLSAELTRLDAVPLAPIVARHARAAQQLAATLAKRVEVVTRLNDARAGGEVAEVIDIVMLHALTNAADHGIETPDARRDAGKVGVGRITVTATTTDDSMEVTVEDDGVGVDAEHLRRLVSETGRWHADKLLAASDDELLKVLFDRDFSTRIARSATSGRGVGLDAVREAIERVGGDVSFTSQKGRGARLTLTVPVVQHNLDASVFKAPGSEAVLAVPATWNVTPVDAPGVAAVDILAALGAAAPTPILPGELVLGASRDGTSDLFLLRAGSRPSPAVVSRLCPTDPDYPAEIVMAYRKHVILVRPNRLRRADEP